MWATILGVAVKSFTDSLLSTVAGLIKSELDRRALMAQGAANQAAAESAQAAKASAAEAQAIANGPNTIQDAAARAKSGTL